MFISFLFLSEERRKRTIPTQVSPKKEEMKQHSSNVCEHSNKNARIFGMFYTFYARFKPQGVAGATRQYFMYDKIRSCFLSEFSVCRSVLPRTFFLLFGSFFFFLLRKKEEKRTKKKYYKLQQIIRLNQKIKICN